MASIVTSVVVESVPRGANKRNRYRYTLDDATVHERRSWIPAATDNATDRDARGAALLEELAQAEINAILGAS